MASPLRGATFFFGFLFPAEAGQNSGVDLLHKMQVALGGVDRIAAIRDIDWTVQAETFKHDDTRIGHVTKRTRWIPPNYRRLDQLGPGDTFVLYFDGANGWEILPGTTNVILLAGSELEFAENYLSGFKITEWTADRRRESTVTSPATNSIRIACGQSSDDIALDPQTQLPAEVLTWRRVQGIRFPDHERHVNPNDASADGRLDRVTFDAGLKPADLAAKPVDGHPVLVGR